MNRTLLLENLPDLLEDLDARLTALEAAEPQAQPVKISYVEHLAAEVKRLTALENNKPNERDWEAAANSALAQLTFSRKNVNWLRDTLDAAQDKIERLLAENRRLTDGFYALEAQLDVLSVDNKNLREGNAELRKHYTNKNDLCAALQKQNVTLWDDNAGLRKDNERLAAEVTRLKGSIVATVNEIDQDLATDNAQLRQDNALMMADKRQLRAALEAVEYDGEYGTCLWCSSLYGYEHFQNCQRQAALR